MSEHDGRGGNRRDGRRDGVAGRRGGQGGRPGKSVEGQSGQRRGPRRTPLDPARQAAFDVLRAVSERDAYANLALPAMLRDRDITGRDAAFATELTYGTCRSIGLLDAVIEHAAGRPTGQIDPVLLDLLRLGTYQLLRTRVDAHAAVDTTVEQAGIEFDTVRAGFVNGVLRTIASKDEAAWVAELAPNAADPIGRTAFTHAHPRWVAQAFADALGADAGELDALLASDDERPIVHLAARVGELTADELAAAVGGEVGRYSPYAVYLPGGDPGQLDPVRDGWAQVQDEGSQLVARALTQVPLDGQDLRWLDLCSGPGGKTALLASIAAGSGAKVTAVEPTEHRADLVERSTRGMGVRVLRVDGRDSGLEPGSFDRVLVDAPCTGLGALRRRPEARWRRQPGDVPALAKLQRELLSAAIKLTRPGGVVLYATCSPHLAETVGVIADAVRRQPVEAIDARPLFAPADRLGPGPHVQLWPHRHGTDAMFAAALKVV
jgi:16S rRNA (cytosine967-C5)-methyltransferase